MEAEVVHAGRGAAYIAVERLASTLVGAVAFAFVARILTQTEMGIMVGLLLIMGVFQILSDFGFASGLAKYVAEYRGKKADYTLVTFTGIWTKSLLAGFFALACALLAPQLSSLLLKDVSYSFFFQLSALDVFFLCVFATVNKLLLGLNRFLEMAILGVTAVVVRQVFGVGLLMLGYGLSGFITGWILGDFTYVAVGSIILLHERHIKMHSPREVMPHLRRLVKFSFPLFLADSVLFLYAWFDRTILLAYIPLKEVAVYNVAYTAFGVLLVVPAALSTALLPYLSEQYGKNMHDRIAVGASAGARYIVLIFTPLALGLMITATPVLTIFAGELYAEGGLVLAILSLFQSIAGVGAIFTVLLLVYNMTPKVLLVNIMSVGISFAASFLLLPILGLAGIAVVKGLSMILTFVFTVVVLHRKRIEIKLDKEVLWKSWGAAAAMSIIVWLVQLAYFSLLLLPFYIIIGGVFYLAVLRLLKVLNMSDIILMRNLVGKRGRILADVFEKLLI